MTLDRGEKKGTVDITIDATSIRTFDTRLDAIVKGERFFNVEKFPTVTFRSDKMTFDGDPVPWGVASLPRAETIAVG